MLMFGDYLLEWGCCLAGTNIFSDKLKIPLSASEKILVPAAYLKGAALGVKVFN